jgi:hypothetical protein
MIMRGEEEEASNQFLSTNSNSESFSVSSCSRNLYSVVLRIERFSRYDDDDDDILQLTHPRSNVTVTRIVKLVW